MLVYPWFLLLIDMDLSGDSGGAESEAGGEGLFFIEPLESVWCSKLELVLCRMSIKVNSCRNHIYATTLVHWTTNRNKLVQMIIMMLRLQWAMTFCEVLPTLKLEWECYNHDRQCLNSNKTSPTKLIPKFLTAPNALHSNVFSISAKTLWYR